MYKKLKNYDGEERQIIIRVEDNTYIPFDLNNSDYQKYLKWLDGYEPAGYGWVKTSDGNTPLPADEPSEGTA